MREIAEGYLKARADEFFTVFSRTKAIVATAIAVVLLVGAIVLTVLVPTFWERLSDLAAENAAEGKLVRRGRTPGMAFYGLLLLIAFLYFFGLWTAHFAVRKSKNRVSRATGNVLHIGRTERYDDAEMFERIDRAARAGTLERLPPGRSRGSGASLAQTYDDREARLVHLYLADDTGRTATHVIGGKAFDTLTMV